MTRQAPRDLEQTLLPRGDAPRQVAWDEVTDPSLISAPVVPLASTGADDDQPRVGRYTILRKLGSGGMGVVYAAFDESLDRKVAIKVLRDRKGDPEGQGRLLREAQALARLSHPNVVGVHDVGTTADGQIYIAMEFITGLTLRSWLEEQPRPRAEILRVFAQAGRGLAAAHAVGLIHRDFKPLSRNPCQPPQTLTAARIPGITRPWWPARRRRGGDIWETRWGREAHGSV